MSRAFIEQFFVKGYGCIRDASLHLTPLHALIGPNDSGKSSLLRALELTARLLGSANDSFEAQDRGYRTQGDERKIELVEFVPFRDLRLTARISSPEVLYSFTSFDLHDDVPSNDAYMEEILLPDGTKWSETGHITSSRKLRNPGNIESGKAFNLSAAGRALVQNARFVRFDPDSLRKDSPLLVGPDEARLLNEQGFGLPAVYDAILNRQDDSMKRIVEQVRELFPTVKVVRLKTTSPNTKAIEVELKSGDRVPARFLSEGLLYYLAFAALPYLEPTSLLLVEEPENGLHPARIADIVRLLREMSKTTQVVMATHSPLVINELSGDEVSVVTRTEAEGTKVTLLRDTPNFEKRSQAYALGELWVSYADGETESALLQGGPPP
jgi:ABC-type multidrug transport system ATPase subunit